MQLVLVQILLIISLFTNILFSQQLTEIKKMEKTGTLGIKAGIYSSNLGYNISETSSHFEAFSTYNDLKIGLMLGSFLELTISKHYAIQFGLNFTFIKHNIKNGYSILSGPIQSSFSGNYLVTYSLAQLCLVQKLSIGRNNRTYFLAAPLFQLPLYTHIKGQLEESSYNFIDHLESSNINKIDEMENLESGGLGFLAGFGFDIPLKNNTISVEITTSLTKVGLNPYLPDWAINNVISDHYMDEKTFSLNFIYKLNLKRNHIELVK